MDSPEQKFFISDDGKEKLSITKAELQAGIDSGKHGEETLAWTKGMSEWLPLSDPSWEKHGIVIEPQPPDLPPLTKSSEKTDLNEGLYSAEPSNEYLKRLGLSPTGKKPAGTKNFKIFEHPFFNPRVIKLGFSWLAFGGGWFFFFYHKCPKAGMILIALSVLSWGLIEGVKEVSFKIHMQNDSIYQYNMREIDKMEQLVAEGEIDSYSQAEYIAYNEQILYFIQSANDSVKRRFENDYVVFFIILDCLLILAVWFFFAKKQSSILEKNLLSKGYKKVFETNASNLSHALALYAAEKESNKVNS